MYFLIFILKFLANFEKYFEFRSFISDIQSFGNRFR